MTARPRGQARRPGNQSREQPSSSRRCSSSRGRRAGRGKGPAHVEQGAEAGPCGRAESCAGEGQRHNDDRGSTRSIRRKPSSIGGAQRAVERRRRAGRSAGCKRSRQQKSAAGQANLLARKVNLDAVVVWVVWAASRPGVQAGAAPTTSSSRCSSPPRNSAPRQAAASSSPGRSARGADRACWTWQLDRLATPATPASASSTPSGDTRKAQALAASRSSWLSSRQAPPFAVAGQRRSAAASSTCNDPPAGCQKTDGSG